MNSASRCGRKLASAASSSRRSGVTSLRPACCAHRSGPRVYLFGNSSAIGTTAGDLPFGTITRALRIIVENQFAAGAARRHHRDGLILVVRRRMAHGDDGIDAVVAEIDDGAAERDGLGAHRHAAEIGVEIDAGEDLARARAQRRADLLPVVAVALLDRRGRRRDQFFVGFAEFLPLAVSLRQFPQAQPDQRRRLRTLAGAARRGGDGGGGLRLRIAEIDQRRDRVGDRLRRALLVERAGEPHQSRIDIGIGRRLVFQFGDDALGDFRPDARRARHHRLVAHGDGGGEIGGLERAEHGQRDLGADALHGLQQPEPFALDVAGESRTA